LRARRILDSPQGRELTTDGRKFLSFCSNDYLGLANDPRVVAAFQRGAAEYGVGSGASHLITGHMRVHHALEEELADFTGSPRALLFSTGYMANLGIAGALLGRGAKVFEDKLNHASLIDAARTSGAVVRRYRHGDMTRLRDMLGQSSGEKLILTDGVFSMDGDVAPLPALAEFALEPDTWLVVDDAHGCGVLGAGGKGSFEHLRVSRGETTLLMGTLGKAFGTFGAFVAGDANLIEILVQFARTYIYTTALPPAIAEATRESLRIVRTEPWRRDALRARMATFRCGAKRLGAGLLESETPIQPIMLGSEERALSVAARMLNQGVLAPAIRPPTVPEGSSRLRVTFSAVHTDDDVTRLLEALAVALAEEPA
jgi:8-amino-7-oxononanoate synthase